jgi:hypothetical protein
VSDWRIFLSLVAAVAENLGAISPPGILELFLARPFGGQSLIQRCVRRLFSRLSGPRTDATSLLRMFSTTLNEDIREIQEQIDVISEKIGDPDFCEKVKMFVIAPLEIQQIFKADAGS